jgi:UDP-2-acetamido-2,6-beta-L-arabino-hexul-4-ose reductase
MNTLRAALFPTHYPLRLPEHIDGRGRLTEVVRAHGGQGQTFVSTTKPGSTRGEHFHLSKFERFAVLIGKARISLRKLFSDEVVCFDVDSASPEVVDMPTMWAHNIRNFGDTDLTTLFWTHTLFDVDASDTYPESVALEAPRR